MKEMIRVLIADDSAAFGKACQKELKSGGFDCVLTQKDGNRVISLLDTQHFDVVVMDVFMSGADAMEVLEHMEPMQRSRWCCCCPQWTRRSLRSR